ncbi:MAG: LacI family DNA-binding transcriptional regulator, partial [Nocardioidaceae bacterium]
LNDRDARLKKVRISAATRSRVLRAAEDLGYAPNQSARGTRRGRTDQVGLVLGHLDSPWAQAMIGEVSSAAAGQGLTTLVLAGGDWDTFLSRGGADGAVIVADDVGRPVEDRLASLAARGVALVVLGNGLEPRGFDVVRQPAGAACDAALRLLLADDRRIACLRDGPPGTSHQNERYASYRRVLTAYGLAVDPGLVRDVHASRDVAYREALDLLGREDRPTAIFATNDLAAISTLWAAHRLGIAVPEDLAIVGVGNSPEGRSADPPLTTVGADSIFDTVADLLLSRMRGAAAAAGRLYESTWSLHQRGTTRPADDQNARGDGHDDAT